MMNALHYLSDPISFLGIFIKNLYDNNIQYIDAPIFRTVLFFIGIIISMCYAYEHDFRIFKFISAGILFANICGAVSFNLAIYLFVIVICKYVYHSIFLNELDILNNICNSYMHAFVYIVVLYNIKTIYWVLMILISLFIKDQLKRCYKNI